MKNKLLICIICLVTFITMDTVKAAENTTEKCAPASPVLYSIAGNNSYEMKVYLSSNNYKTGHFYKQKINGNWALCLIMGYSSNSSYEFFPKPIEETPYNNSAVKKAYQFILNSRNNGQEEFDMAYVLAQIVIWTSVGGDNLKVALTSAYCSTFTYGFAQNGCAPYQKGYESTKRVYSNKINSLLSKYQSTPAYTGKLAVYYSTTSGAQPLLAAYKCSETCEETNTCEERPTPVPSCKYTLDVNVPNSCDVSTSGYVNDMKDWKCIFKSTSSGDNNIKKHYVEAAIDDQTNNPYCASYCREEVSWIYPDAGTEVYQGRFMTLLKHISGVPSIQPIEYHGMKECRVTDRLNSDKGTINWGQFVKDYNSYNGQEASLWNNANEKYKVWQAYLDAGKHPQGTYVCHTTASCDGFDGEAGNKYGSVSMSDARSRARSKCEDANNDIRNRYNDCTNACASASQQAALVGQPAPPCNCKMGNLHNCGNCSDGSTHRCTKYKGSYTHNEYGTATVSYIDSEYGPYDDAPGVINAAASAYTSARNSYISNSNNRTRVINQIRACSDPNVKYSLNPDLSFEYEEPIYGSEFDLDKIVSDSQKITYYKGGNSTNNGGAGSGSVPQSNQTAYKNCGNAGGTAHGRKNGNGNSIGNDRADIPSGQHCGSDKYFTYPITDWWKYTLKSDVSYDWKANVYRYINKDDGSSTNTPSSNYIDIGFSVLPIHYSTMPGAYPFRITLSSEDFGEGSKLGKYVYTDVPFDGKKYGIQSNVYGCTYTVRCQRPVVIRDCETYNDNTCKGQITTCSESESGLNLIYRPISLFSKTDAFPGINGDGREPGFNWNDDDDIEAYIVKNRGVNDYNVYHLDPMYEITLTPAKMKIIRKYNKYMNTQMSNVIFTREPAILGYADFENMSCSNGKNCRSAFIRGNAVTSGTNSVSSSELAKIKVTGCAVNGTNKPGGGTYNNCGNTVAW